MDDQYRDLDIMIPAPKTQVSMKGLVKKKNGNDQFNTLQIRMFGKDM